MINNPHTLAKLKALVGKSFKKGGVPETPELHRVLDLPRRVWEKNPQLEELTQAVTQYLKIPHGRQKLRPLQAVALQEAHDLGGLFGPIPVGEGKAQPDTEPVLLEQGWTPIGNVNVGDRIYGSDGKLHNVTGVHRQGLRPVYKVTFSDRTWTLSTEDHLWTFRGAYGLTFGGRPGGRGGKGKPQETKTLKEWEAYGLHRVSKGQRVSKLFLPLLSSPIERHEQCLPLDPYTLGALIGDGAFSQESVGFTSMDDDIVTRLRLPSGLRLKKRTYQNSGKATDYAIRGDHGRKRDTKGGCAPNPLKEILKSLGLMGCTSHTKFVPDLYKKGSPQQRLELLQGLCDTDGSVSRGKVEFSSASKVLAEDVAELVESLGGVARRQYREKHTRVLFSLPKAMMPFVCARKRDLYSKRVSDRQREPYRAVESIRLMSEQQECTCLSVDTSDSLYVTRNHILTHNTLISFLAPVVLEAQRPVLVVPARLRDKTIREFAALGQHWKSHPRLEIVSYEKLSREGGTKYLQKLQPDLLIFDEVHKLKNRDAAVTRKVSAWMKTFPETRVIAMSGTITKRSLLDFAHVLRWALPDSCPLPQPLGELEAWAAAVDEIKQYEQRVQTGAGALIAFCSPEEKLKGLNGIRFGLRRRIQETPGVVATQGQSVSASLNIALQLVDDYNDRIKSLAVKLHEGVLPNGDVYIVEGKENSATALQARWRIMRTLTSGFWYDWDPRPPKEWLELRSTWKKIVRRILEEHLPGLESEALVTKAAAQMKLGLAAHDTYKQWAAVKDSHKWRVVPQWEDDCVIDRVAAWAKKHDGLIWVSEVALGQRLEEKLGLPYFHEMGRDSLGRAVETMDPSDGSVVVSVASNSEGRNLQAWNENLVISPPPTGTVWEQLIGRTHRQGQEADEVWVDVLIGCEVEWQCWLQAMKDARYASGIEGMKKLMYATVDQTFRVPSSDGFLW